jgi:hypothetical protein
MFSKLWNAVKGWMTNEGIPKGVDKDKPFKGERVIEIDKDSGRRDYVYQGKDPQIPKDIFAEKIKFKDNRVGEMPRGEKVLIHPRTKKEVTPLSSVYKDPLAYIKVLSDATFGEDQWPATKKIIMDESSGNPKAFNGTYLGLFQNNKDLFSSDEPSLDEQFKVWSNYIRTHIDNRTGKPYGTPSQALDFRENEAPKYKASGDPRYANFSINWY